jgi:hypothetical protein
MVIFTLQSSNGRQAPCPLRARFTQQGLAMKGKRFEKRLKKVWKGVGKIEKVERGI